MTQALATNSSGITGEPTPPTAEGLHLRRFIEKQPACVLRVGLDGVLLAVNEAALSLIGAEQLTQVLGTKLTGLIIPRRHDEWEEFAGRIRDAASASIECDMTDMSGTRRVILLHGVPLLDHPDGVPSMILSARDISASRRIETALLEREASRELKDLQKQIEQGLAERHQLATSLTQRERTDQRAAAEYAADRAQLQQTLAEEHQRALLLKEREGRQLLDGLRAELEQALAERHQLAASLKEREADYERAVAEHAADRAQLQQTLAEEYQRALLLKEREGRQLLDGLRAELEQALAERHQLAASLKEREASLQREVADREDLQQTLAEAGQLLLKEQESRQFLDGLRVDLEEALTARQRLEASLEEHEANHRRLEAEHVAERAQLQQTLVEEHQLAMLLKERESRQLLGNLKTELEQALASRQQLATSLEEREVDHQRLVSEHAAARAEAEQGLAAARLTQAELEKALADLRVDLRGMDENARNLEWLAAAGRAAREIGRELQIIVAAVDARTLYLLAQSSLKADNRHVIESLRGDAIDAASLVRQIVQADAEATTFTDSAEAADAPSHPSNDAGRPPC